MRDGRSHAKGKIDSQWRPLWVGSGGRAASQTPLSLILSHEDFLPVHRHHDHQRTSLYLSLLLFLSLYLSMSLSAVLTSQKRFQSLESLEIEYGSVHGGMGGWWMDDERFTNSTELFLRLTSATSSNHDSARRRRRRQRRQRRRRRLLWRIFSNGAATRRDRRDERTSWWLVSSWLAGCCSSWSSSTLEVRGRGARGAVRSSCCSRGRPEHGAVLATSSATLTKYK